jgi:septum formation protein
MQMVANKLIMASGSTFRHKLLMDAGVPFLVCVPAFDEHSLQSDDPRELARLRATGKASATAKGQLNSVVIGADQTLGIGPVMLGKAKDRAEAKQYLRLLSGRTHHLYSAYTLIYSGRVVEDPRILVERVVDCPMVMRDLTDDAIERYLDTKEWEGCAGCYRVEGKGILLMESIAPTHSGIMGLPMMELLQDLRQIGIDLLAAPSGPWELAPKA